MDTPHHNSRYLDQPRRSPEQYLGELVARFNALALDDPARPALARRIREVETEVDTRSEAGKC